MTPIEVMARAYYEEQIDGFGCDYHELEKEARANRERCLRAALLALAEMEPTEEMRKAMRRCRDAKHWPKAYIRAAANEGKTKAEIAKPILDGMVARGELLEPK